MQQNDEQKRATLVLCNAGKYLVATRNLDPKMKVCDMPRNADSDACRVLAVCLCLVNGASPEWSERIKEILNLRFPVDTRGASR